MSFSFHRSKLQMICVSIQFVITESTIHLLLSQGYAANLKQCDDKIQRPKRKRTLVTTSNKKVKLDNDSDEECDLAISKRNEISFSGQ